MCRMRYTRAARVPELLQFVDLLLGLVDNILQVLTLNVFSVLGDQVNNIRDRCYSGFNDYSKRL